MDASSPPKPSVSHMKRHRVVVSILKGFIVQPLAAVNEEE
jgi:hypothetical protein